ncbi:MAG: hypothetical protein RLZZ117_747 [Cyanobacteriota bacterium]|jgi:glycerol dehydrogenase
MPSAVITHAIAPRLVLRGSEVWPAALEAIHALGRRPLLLGRSSATRGLRRDLQTRLEGVQLAVQPAELHHDCCEADLGRLGEEARQGAGDPASGPCDLIIAMGGGKVLDAGKLLAHRLQLPCVTIPTSAATCAGWTNLSNLYTPSGAFLGDVTLARCPDVLVFDHELVRQAPTRTLVSGIADAMAKWYEASVSSAQSGDGLVQQAVQQARLLRDQMLLNGQDAVADPTSDAWVRVAEGAALTAGLIGGLGGARCRTVAAHAVHNGLTQLPTTHAHLHGEKVGFGILVQLRLEEVLGGNRLAGQARQQLLAFFRSLDLPCDLEDLGLLDTSVQDLLNVCLHACREGSDLHHLPFAVDPHSLLAALVNTTSQPVALG